MARTLNDVYAEQILQLGYLHADPHPGNLLVQPGPRLLPVTLPPSTPAIELVLSTGAVLRLSPGCDLAWVRSLVAALGDPPC